MLGAQSKFEEKSGLAVVNGAHDTSTMQELLLGFIKKFVLCEKCGLPETDLKVSKKSDTINALCRACGNAGVVDPREKLAGFIVKNPPPSRKKGKEEEKKKDERQLKKERRAEKHARRASTMSTDSTSSKAKKGEAGSDDEGSEESQIEEIPEDPEEEAAAEETVEDPAVASGESSSPSIKDKVDAKAASGSSLFAALAPKAAELSHADQVAAAREIFEDKQPALARVEVEATKAGIVKENMIDVIFEAIFDDECVAVAEKQVKFLSKLAKEVSQKRFLQNLEKTFTGPNAAHLKKFPLVLKALYDEDVVEEEHIIQWFENSDSDMVDADAAKKSRAVSKPFIEWLQTADEESD